MKFTAYISLLTKFAFSSALAIGLVSGLFLLFQGGLTGEVNLDLDFSAADGIWLLLGIPALVTAVVLLLSPLSYFIHAGLARIFARK